MTEFVLTFNVCVILSILRFCLCYQAGGSGDMVAHGIASPASVRSSTPASTNTLTTYTSKSL